LSGSFVLAHKPGFWRLVAASGARRMTSNELGLALCLSTSYALGPETIVRVRYDAGNTAACC
jgi:hypothetical protein